MSNGNEGRVFRSLAGRQHIWIVWGAVVSVFVLALMFARSDTVNPHGDENRCGECHTGPPPDEYDESGGAMEATAKGPYPLRSDSDSSLCSRCHKMSDGQTHPIEVRPSSPTPPDWPLDETGLLVCSTCHDPHLSTGPSSQGRRSYLLRGNQEGEDFCRVCHDRLGGGDPRSWHIVAATSTHGREPDSESSSLSEFDPLSARCLGCHDGTIGRDVGRAVGLAQLNIGQAVGHPIGVEYEASLRTRQQSRRFSNLRDRALLDERIRLFDGKVGCGSCHNPYADNPSFLVIEPRGGQLCLSCHDM